MGLITINCLSDAATLTGDESFLLYQKNQTLKTGISSLKPITNCFEGFNNSAVCDPQTTGTGRSGIIGGQCGSLSGCNSGILFGNNNNIFNSGACFPLNSAILGGYGNKICDDVGGSAIIASQCAVLADTGGSGNPSFNAIISSSNSVISGGMNAFNFIAGGKSNIISCESSGYYTTNSSIIGGKYNRIYGQSNVIIGGSYSKAGSLAKTQNNRLCGQYAVVIGGGKFADLFSGGGNEAVAGFTSVINGTNNLACAAGGTIIGGCSNTVQQHSASCFLNLESGGTILGGANNTILTGHENSIIVGGTSMSTVSSNMLHTNTLFLSADILPTSNPNIKGVVWNDSGTLKISLSTL